MVQDYILKELERYRGRRRPRPLADLISDAGRALMAVDGRGLKLDAGEVDELLEDVREDVAAAGKRVGAGDYMEAAYLLVQAVNMVDNALGASEPHDVDRNLLGWFDSWLDATKRQVELWRSEDSAVTITRGKYIAGIWPGCGQAPGGAATGAGGGG